MSRKAKQVIKLEEKTKYPFTDLRAEKNFDNQDLKKQEPTKNFNEH